MARNLRNFWLSAHVDGRKTSIGSGPRAKDGGFTLQISMRENGERIAPIRIVGRVTEEGALVLEVFHFTDTNPYMRLTTQR